MSNTLPNSLLNLPQVHFGTFRTRCLIHHRRSPKASDQRTETGSRTGSNKLSYISTGETLAVCDDFKVLFDDKLKLENAIRKINKINSTMIKSFYKKKARNPKPETIELIKLWVVNEMGEYSENDAKHLNS
ncbi:9464_t:CDS:2 [Ambispora gerdemannii]|uniref:9464_t:CDS:1 n=1 Tax=Ambispora gerdemannii TaxID=144530 RepID=A0A9N9CED1_9GLOM|nr:9464_t:CDS:2 [Ambispora gerdemannii]